jgi:AcrR family transcriptional regulator
LSSRHAITCDEALDAARRRFLATGDLVMSRLQRDLNVSRATLYQVVGGRDRLLGDVLFDLARRTLEVAVREVGQQDVSGIDRMLEISRRFETAIASSEPLQRFLTTHPQIALPVLFTSAGRVHERMVDLWSESFVSAVEAGDLALPDGPRETAYLYVRVGESVLFRASSRGWSRTRRPPSGSAVPSSAPGDRRLGGPPLPVVTAGGRAPSRTPPRRPGSSRRSWRRCAARGARPSGAR